jgi:hypothetical protein
MDWSDPTTGIAVAAAALGVVNLLLAAWFLRWMRRVRRAQEALLAGKNVDLIEFAVGMHTRMEMVEETVSKAVAQMETTNRRLDECYQHRAIVRYDAIKDIGGRQSSSIAILDGGGNGLVVSAIQGRDYARIYVKDVVDGKPGSVELTPEERQAVEHAMA